MLLGAHVSTAGGLPTAPARGKEIGADIIQIFTRNQRQWRHPPVTDEEATAFRAAMKESGLKGAMSHASYLLNLASPNPALWEQSLEAFEAEARRCEAIGVDRFVFHPGSHMATSVEAGRSRVAKALRRTLDATQGFRGKILLETMAGHGSTIGDRFEDLAAIIGEAGGDPRLGVCLDTCHVFAAGFDIATEKGYALVMDQLDRTVGLKRLLAVQINDSKGPLGCRVDRHETIGNGTIGKAGFRPLMSDGRLKEIPMALETPEPEGWAKEIKLLRSLATK